MEPIKGANGANVAVDWLNICSILAFFVALSPWNSDTHGSILCPLCLHWLHRLHLLAPLISSLRGLLAPMQKPRNFLLAVGSKPTASGLKRHTHAQGLFGSYCIVIDQPLGSKPCTGNNKKTVVSLIDLPSCTQACSVGCAALMAAS